MTLKINKKMKYYDMGQKEVAKVDKFKETNQRKHFE